MSNLASNIVWIIVGGTIVLLLLALGLIVATIQSKRKEMLAKQRELEELAKREAKYRNLFENSLAGMLRIDFSTWDVLEANSALLGILGVNNIDEVKKVLETIPQSDLEHIKKSLLEKKMIKNYHITIKRKDGIEACLSFSGSLFYGENVVEGVIIDITEQKRLEAKQLRLQRMESIGVLASGIAHDLKNYLVPVKLATEILKRKISDTQIQDTLTSISMHAEFSIELTQQVLYFVKGIEGNYIPIQASELLRQVMYAIHETLPSNIMIVSEIPNMNTLILGDNSQLRQVFVNLINNAKDAMPNGGKLTLRLCDKKVKKEEVDSYLDASEGDYVVFSVSDTGFGIPPDKREKIFEPFYTTKEIGRGTGLGLSIVAGIVKSHKGFIKVDSEVGKGTTFHVYLPVYSNK